MAKTIVKINYILALLLLLSYGIFTSRQVDGAVNANAKASKPNSESRSEITIKTKINGCTISGKYSDRFFDSYRSKNCVIDNKELLKISAFGVASTYENMALSPKEFLNKCGFKKVISKFTGTGTSSSFRENDNCTFYAGEKRADVRSPASESIRTIAVVISGYSHNSYEWISNFNLGNGKTHAGFEIAANKVIEYIVNKYNPDKKDIIWIMGHSRGGAVTNLVAEYFVEKGYSNVYAYGFATPNVSTNVRKSKRILNIVNTGDFVPFVPLSQWGYDKNGTTKLYSMGSKRQDLFKSYTGKASYNGMSESSQKLLISHFNQMCNYSKYGYTASVHLNPGLTGLHLSVVSPKLYMQSGLALFMNGDQNVKKAGLAIMLELSAVNTSYAFLTAHLAIKQTGDINPQISDAHMMETYLAIVNSLK